MEFWRIAQMMYMLLSFVGTGILTIALVTVITWPQLRGRGLLLTALAMKLITVAGYLMLHLLGLVSTFAPVALHLPGEVMQVGFISLAVIGLTGDGLLLLALISLASALRDIQAREALTHAPPLGPPEKF